MLRYRVSGRWLSTSSTGNTYAQIGFQVGDRVLLRQNGSSAQDKPPLLTAPLIQNGKTDTYYGSIEHAVILGKAERELVTTTKDCELRVDHPTLDEYTRFTRRMVTPVYPADANLITSLLDLHPDIADGEAHGPSLRILEAGTGHGSLTLHLARAIHGANPSLPPDLRRSLANSLRDKEGGDGTVAQLEKWKQGRRAWIDTVDASREYSRFAMKVVYGFRQSIYAGDVDFHIGNVSEWLKERVASAGGIPFLDHIILDLPSAHNHIKPAATALRSAGSLVVFAPSISQIQSCVQIVRQQRLPLVLDKTLELGTGLSGGREWLVRSVKPRALIRQEREAKSEVLGTADGPVDSPTEESEAVLAFEGKGNAAGSDRQSERGPDSTTTAQDGDNGHEWICRPKVGVRVYGGGFLGIWKRARHKGDSCLA